MMKGYQKQDCYADNFNNASGDNGWNYSLFGYNDYNDTPQSYYPQYNYNNFPQVDNWNNFNNGELPYAKNVYQQPLKKASNSNMLKAKKSGRVFYPSKANHSRHNSHDNKNKAPRADLSPLNRSHDST
mmetsp:Transcript_21275/g.23683  ORF Transcript_21275/g.23683 Transcript_21275/m.23683 type:complete len:128 (+) Transcript_21275:14-397(+)